MIVPIDQRDERRRFSRSQRASLYVAADGRCEFCGCVLPEEWHAHHVDEWAEGGATEEDNGKALCEECHREEHVTGASLKEWQKEALAVGTAIATTGGAMSATSAAGFRAWQIEALNAAMPNDRALIEATPGAGKTFFAGAVLRRALDTGEITYCIAVVPTTALRASAREDMEKAGVKTKSKMGSTGGPPRAYKAVVCTYQELPNRIDQFERWARNGERLAFVFDEVHHASESNSWGNTAARCNAIATRIVSMSGTPFRTDGQKIVFVNYDGDQARPDFRYSMRRAIADRVCRPIEFVVHNYTRTVADPKSPVGMTEESLRGSPLEQVASLCRGAFKADGPWMRDRLQESIAKLDEYRLTDDDAAMLVVCQPGLGESEEKHAQEVADVIHRMTGERPTVVLHEDRMAAKRLRDFKRGKGRFLVAVRMVSEGVNIPRLRIGLLAMYTFSEMLLRQIVGRFQRWESDGTDEQIGTVFIAHVDPMEEIVRRIEDEARAGLRDRQPVRKKLFDDDDDPPTGGCGVIVLNERGEHVVTHFRGVQMSPEEIALAERVISINPDFRDLGAAQLLRIYKAMAQAVPGPGMSADQAPTVTEEEVRNGYRNRINKLLRAIAVRRKVEFQPLYSAFFRAVGVRNLDDLTENRTLKEIESAFRIPIQWASAEQIDVSAY